MVTYWHEADVCLEAAVCSLCCPCPRCLSCPFRPICVANSGLVLSLQLKNSSNSWLDLLTARDVWFFPKRLWMCYENISIRKCWHCITDPTVTSVAGEDTNTEDHICQQHVVSSQFRTTVEKKGWPQKVARVKMLILRGLEFGERNVRINELKISILTLKKLFLRHPTPCTVLKNLSDQVIHVQNDRW